MRLVLTFSLLFGFITYGQSQTDSIQIQFEIENQSSKPFTSGVLNIQETGYKKTIKSTHSFSILLPQKGKYSFTFETPGFFAVIDQPRKIRKNNKTIEIKLYEKTEKKIYLNSSTPHTFIENLFQKNVLTLYYPSITAQLSNEQLKFSQTYNIQFQTISCTINGLELTKIQNHNKRITRFLKHKFKLPLEHSFPLNIFGVM